MTYCYISSSQADRFYLPPWTATAHWLISFHSVSISFLSFPSKQILFILQSHTNYIQQLDTLRKIPVETLLQKNSALRKLKVCPYV
jgi:hypothetical protein